MRNAPALQIMGWEINLLGDDRGEGGGVLATDTLEAVGRRQGRQKDAFSKYHENLKIPRFGRLTIFITGSGWLCKWSKVEWFQCKQLNHIDMVALP